MTAVRPLPENMNDEHRLLAERLNMLTAPEQHAFDLQLTLIRTAFESYKRESVFKPCPSFLHGLDDEQLVSQRNTNTHLVNPRSLEKSLSSTAGQCVHIHTGSVERSSSTPAQLAAQP